MRDTGSVPGSGRSSGEGNGNHPSTLAWRIPWTEEPGGLQSIGSHRVRHDSSDLTHTRGFPGGTVDKNLPMQGTQVWSRAWKGSTCWGATNPMCGNFGAHALKPACCSYWSPRALGPTLRKKRIRHNDKPTHCNEEEPLLTATREILCSNKGPAQPKQNKINK